MAEESQSTPETHFSAERTFLAWIQTGLALMGAGLAVARFGVSIQQAHASEVSAALHTVGGSLRMGVAVVALGAAVLLSALVEHVRTVRALRNGTWQPGRVSIPAVVLALLLATGGLGIGVYLLVVH